MVAEVRLRRSGRGRHDSLFEQEVKMKSAAGESAVRGNVRLDL